MPEPQTSYYDIGLVTPDDPEYVAFMRRMADRRPARGGPRAAGEYLGGLVERAVQHWLGSHVPLQAERILTWEQRLKNGRFGRLYRELDAVWRIDPESLCLYEIKFTHANNIAVGVGINQLDIAAEILFAQGAYQYILKRLVYVTDTPMPVLEDEPLPTLEPNDEYEELGVIWVPLDTVAAAAQELELELPENWRDPEAREGTITTAEQEEWRQYADTAARTSGDESEVSADNPLAQALQRALRKEP